MTSSRLIAKNRKKLRYVEYYNSQKLHDELFRMSKKGCKFKNLVELIMDKDNIKLAYRTIKRNKGSKTEGTDGKTIRDFEKIPEDVFVKRIQNKLMNYNPKPVRRVLIEKQGTDKKRPLGIPCFEDRIIQQSIKQIIEPICEAKFYEHSYGFRPNRRAEHAVVRLMSLMNISKFHYCVDIDIEGFFDNVNHSKLIKQLWSLGIRDKNLLSIIKKMLKCEVEGEGTQKKGTPQGGILSPLLSNIVLNELDWWISSQWETMKTEHQYESIDKRNGTINRSNKYRALRNGKLKEMFIVRYADDFKIMCKDAKSAQKTFVAVKKWLKERLGLDISKEKSKITNLRKNYTEFLGLKLKVAQRKKKYICKSHISNKAKKKIIKEIKDGIYKIQKKPSIENVCKLNAIILGQHNYYNQATMVNMDYQEIFHKTRIYMYNRLKKVSTDKGEFGKLFLKMYGHYNFKTYFVRDIAIFPIAGVKHVSRKALNKDINKYTEEGRKLIHKNMNERFTKDIEYLLDHPVKNRSVEYNDNRISKYLGQRGLCGVTKEKLEINNMHCHHIVPRFMGGKDNYENLILINKDIHVLIHAKKENTINEYKKKYSKDVLKKVNVYRKLVGNSEILVNTY